MLFDDKECTYSDPLHMLLLFSSPNLNSDSSFEEKYFPVLSSSLPIFLFWAIFTGLVKTAFTHQVRSMSLNHAKISHKLFLFNVEEESSWNCTLPSIKMHQDGCWNTHTLVHRHMDSLETDASLWKLPLIFWVRLALREYFCALLQQSAEVLLPF